MKLQELVKNIQFKGVPDNREISAITYDSRKVKQGTLFVAIAGMQTDGHKYIPEAIEKGAAAVLSNGLTPECKTIPILQVKDPRLAMSHISANFFGNPSKYMHVTAITGTNGKTSITHILNHILKQSGLSCGTLGTLGFSTPTGMVSTSFTTPESVEVQQMLKTLQSAGVENIVMEISSHALDLHRVEDVDVDIAVFTNLTPEHLDFHGDMERYFQSKLQLFRKLSAKNTAVLNLDDPYTKRIISTTSAKIITYGLQNKACLHPLQYEYSLTGTQAILNYEDVQIPINSSLIGEYNLSNIMASVSACLNMGITAKQIGLAIQSITSIPGRLEHIQHEGKGKVYIDYAHTSDAFEKLLFNLKNLSEDGSDISVVFGCGGDRDRSKRAKMAAAAEKFTKHVYLTTDNPRTESLEKINQDTVMGFTGNNYRVITDRQEAIHTALSEMNDQSILVVLGKGRETYQEIGTEKIPYSDVEVIKSFQDAD